MFRGNGNTSDAYLYTVEYFQSGLRHLDGYVPSLFFLLSTHGCFNYPCLFGLLIAYFVNCSPSRSPPINHLSNARRAQVITLFPVSHCYNHIQIAKSLNTYKISGLYLSNTLFNRLTNDSIL